MTIYTSKKNRKIVEPMHNQGIEKRQLVQKIYNRLEPKPVHRNRLIAWMKRSKMEGGASFENDFAAGCFLDLMLSEGCVFDFE